MSSSDLRHQYRFKQLHSATLSSMAAQWWTKHITCGCSHRLQSMLSANGKTLVSFKTTGMQPVLSASMRTGEVGMGGRRQKSPLWEERKKNIDMRMTGRHVPKSSHTTGDLVKLDTETTHQPHTMPKISDEKLHATTEDKAKSACWAFTILEVHVLIEVLIPVIANSPPTPLGRYEVRI